MKKLFLLIAVFLISVSGIAQMITIIDKSDLQAIPNVAVIGKNYSVTSDKNGSVDISNFKTDDVLTFKHIAYQSYAISKKDIISSGNLVLLTDNIIKLDEVVFSANKIDENKSDIPHHIEVISSKQISFNNPQTTGDLLQQSGNVFIQQSQMGGSSPVLRGFEANKVLMVMDGVRMNNAIYRSGHLQNVITIDPNVLDRVEVVFGPGSVMYGSDAIGGVMAFFTKNPVLSMNEKLFVNSAVSTRYSSANNETAGNVNFNIGMKKWAFLSSISYKNLGDLRMGTNGRDSKYGDWGKSLYYAERINGKDSMMTNSNPNIQKKSGYSQYDIMQKVLFQPNDQMKYILNLQFSNSSDVPRYDRLAEMDGSKLKYADWYYGPQSRFFAALRCELKGKYAMYDNAAVNIAYQNISEDRVNRRFNKTAVSHQEETVDVLSLNADIMKKITEKNELRYGLEAVSNHVGSVAYNINVSNDIKTFNNVSRYPDNGSDYTTIAAYASHNWEINKLLIFSQGIRLSSINMKSEYSDTMMKLTKFPFDKNIQQNNAAINGNLGLVYMPGKDWRFAVMASSGFRAPNVDDVTKVNDSKAGSLIVIPNPELKPEYAYNLDVSIGKTVLNKFQIELCGFYTLLKDAIVIKASTFNGQDSMLWGGLKTAVQSATNAGEAYVLGLQANVLLQLSEKLSLSSNLTYTYGRLKAGDLPLDHIPPLFGMTSLKFETRKFKAEIYSRYNGWKNLKDYSTSGEDNLPQASVDGTPLWYTLNVRSAYQLNKYLNVQIGMENILDRYYRNFASGISAPGRNFVVAMKATF
jgi:hemoglobin/transferrin/lactoferrin receptor protein